MKGTLKMWDQFQAKSSERDMRSGVAHGMDEQIWPVMQACHAANHNMTSAMRGANVVILSQRRNTGDFLPDLGARLHRAV